jgi:hypothetical protein
MKKLITIVALGASIIAGPAFAQTATRTIDEGWGTQGYTQINPARSSNPRNDVYVNGRYVGSDPDPTVRESLRTDLPMQY